MKVNKFIQELDRNQDYFKEWVQDSHDDNIFYYWKNESRGYLIHFDSMIIENICDSENYQYKAFDNHRIKEVLDRSLSKRIDELNRIDNYSDIFEKWLIDEEDNSKYYYWKGENKGYLAIVEDDGIKLPRIKKD